MGSINYSQAIRPDTAYIRKIIENSLLADWAIRIEYQGGKPEIDGWQLWGKTFYAMRSAELIIKALTACYTKYPECTIRISAEKFRPQTNMLYTVYDPQYLPVDMESKHQASKKQLSRVYDQSSTRTVLR